MVDISKYVDSVNPESDVDVMRRRFAAACEEIAIAMSRWMTQNPEDPNGDITRLPRVEVFSNGFPRLIVEDIGIPTSTTTRHEFNTYAELAEFLLNESTVGDLP